MIAWQTSIRSKGSLCNMGSRVRVKRGLFIKRQFLNSLLLSLFRNKSLGRVRQRNPPQAMLDRIAHADTALK